MKRKLGYNDASSSIYAAPALESTLLLESGGLDDKNQIGFLPSTNISAAVSSGTKNFQYNRYFWNKELFSFNYTNNSVGIAIAYWSNTYQCWYFAIYPIFLPRIAMTLLQSISSSSVSDDPYNYELLIKELVYYLNMGFTTLGVGNNYGLQQKGLGFTIAPWLTAQDAKGSIYSSIFGPLIQNNPLFPIFQDGGIFPPLVWSYTGNNYQLCLQINPTFFVDEYENDRIGFQIITLEQYMANSPTVSDPTFPGGFQPSSTYFNPNFNNAPEASYGSTRGWCTQGVFATGFAQQQFYDTDPGNAARSNSSTSYSDIYSSEERLNLWGDTVFPAKTVKVDSYSSFLQLCTKHKLVTNTGVNGQGFVIAHFISSMIPARFFVIESDALTRNQKRPVISNNPSLAPSCMAVQFMTLDILRTWEDNTVAGQTSSAGSILFGSRKSGVDDCSIVALDPMQSLQVLDLTLRDEWGNILTNYMELNNFSSSQQYSIMGPNELFAVSPGSWFPLPTWVTSYNPIPSSNDESILINESWWSSVYQFYSYNPTSTTLSLTNQDFHPSTPRSTVFTHFGRVLGH